MSWSLEFDEPIALPAGRELRTLRDAGYHLIALPASEAELARWQLAAGCVLSAAERRGPVMLARIAMVKALTFGEPDPSPAPRKQAAKKYRIIR
jgi:hypothetical protein